MLHRPLIEKNRLRARLALYLSPVLIMAVLWALTRAGGPPDRAMAWHGVDFTKHESVRLFQEYLRIDTSYPDGNEIPGAEFLARQLEAAGIATHVERLGSRNANLWAILEGEDPQALVLHNHMDVEPAPEAGKWRHPPFSGILEPPFIYGRGAFDMKSLGIAQMMSMLKLKRDGETLERSLVFLATGDEERFSRLGTRRVISEHPELVDRFYAVLTEGGAIEAVDLDSVKYWGTELGQKRFVDASVCDGSRQRLEALREELMAIEAPPRPPSGAIARFLRIYSGSRDSLGLRHLLGSPETMLEDADYPRLPPHLKAMTRNEIYPFPIEADPEGGYQMRMILHLLPDSSVEDAMAELLPGGLETFGLVSEIPHGPVAPSDMGHPVYQTIHEYMVDTLPNVTHGPLFLPWVATDARFFRAQGIPSYGYSPFWILSSDTIKMKGRNERMAAPAFVEGVERYQELVRRLVTAPRTRPAA